MGGYAANPGQPPYFRRTLPETRVTVPGLPHGTRYALLLSPKTVKHPYSFGPIPSVFILRYRLLRSSPSNSAVRVTFPLVSSSFLRM